MGSVTVKRNSLRLISASLPVQGIALDAFLRLGAGNPRFAWLDVGSRLVLAGFGVATELKAWGEQRFRAIERQARRLFEHAWMATKTMEGQTGPRLFGGFAFRDDFVPDNTWAVFYPAHFVLPHIQFTQYRDESWLIINALIPQDADPERESAQLREALELRYHWMQQTGQGLAKKPQISLPGREHREVQDSSSLQVRYPMSLEAWSMMVERALDEIEAKRLKKVVLARMCEIRCMEPVDVIAALAVVSDRYPNCYRFLFEPQPQQAFFGATPEMLASVEGRELHSMALAGSMPRGQSPLEDERLGIELLQSGKNRVEHKLVVDELRHRLAGWCEKIDIPEEPGLLKLDNIQHLYTPVCARLEWELGVLRVIERLHPTPALGGKPRNRALAFIRQAEPVTRGWYAAPVGWIDARLDGAFGVAIRSAVTQNERAWLYAGAGIVADSQPQKEWEETALKFKPALQALGLEVEGLMA
jgi:menaquinone-specific isochorismate synthase